MPTGHQLLWKLMNELHQTVFHFIWMTSHLESICDKQTVLQRHRWCWREKNFAACGAARAGCGSRFLCKRAMEYSPQERQLPSERCVFLLEKNLFKVCEMLLNWKYILLRIHLSIRVLRFSFQKSQTRHSALLKMWAIHLCYFLDIKLQKLYNATAGPS